MAGPNHSGAGGDHPAGAAPTTVALGNSPVLGWFTQYDQNIFMDANKNGVYDANEKGISNVTMSTRYRDGGISIRRRPIAMAMDSWPSCSRCSIGMSLKPTRLASSRPASMSSSMVAGRPTPRATERHLQLQIRYG